MTEEIKTDYCLVVGGIVGARWQPISRHGDIVRVIGYGTPGLQCLRPGELHVIRFGYKIPHTKL